MLGLDENVRPGLNELRAKITIGGDANEETLREIAGLGLNFSLVKDTVANGIAVNPEIRIV